METVVGVGCTAAFFTAFCLLVYAVASYYSPKAIAERETQEARTKALFQSLTRRAEELDEIVRQALLEASLELRPAAGKRHFFEEYLNEAGPEDFLIAFDASEGRWEIVWRTKLKVHDWNVPKPPPKEGFLKYEVILAHSLDYFVALGGTAYLRGPHYYDYKDKEVTEWYAAQRAFFETEPNARISSLSPRGLCDALRALASSCGPEVCCIAYSVPQRYSVAAFNYPPK